jgi:hypothetical protein
MSNEREIAMVRVGIQRTTPVDECLVRTGRMMKIVCFFMACLPLAGFTFGLSPKIIPFAILALLGIFGARYDAFAWFAIVYVPIYQTIAMITLILNFELGAIPGVVGLFLWLLYVQGFLFLKGYSRIVVESNLGGDSSDDFRIFFRDLFRNWTFRSIIGSVCALVFYCILQFDLGVLWVLATFTLISGYVVVLYVRIS